MIYETVITTLNEDGSVHIAPMGITEEDGLVQIAPFKPSTTLENLQRTQHAVVNMTDDVQVFAGCLTGRRQWPTVSTEHIEGQRLAAALSHMELEVERLEDDEIRPRFYCKVVHQQTHAPFKGFNRAQAAVLEAAILVSRLHMLSKEKIQTELEYLTIAIEKTAGEKEQEAWGWLMQRIDDYYTQQAETNTV